MLRAELPVHRKRIVLVVFILVTRFSLIEARGGNKNSGLLAWCRASEQSRKRTELEVQPQRKLNLPVCAQSNGSLDGAVDHTESATRQRRSEWLTGLQARRRAEGIGQLGGRI